MNDLKVEITIMLDNIDLQIILTTDNTSSKPTLFVDWTIVILKKDIDDSVKYYIKTSKENDCVYLSLSDSQSNFRLNW